jgi:hypothetical protein
MLSDIETIFVTHIFQNELDYVYHYPVPVLENLHEQQSTDMKSTAQSDLLCNVFSQYFFTHES